jgi:hypothetical protein
MVCFSVFKILHLAATFDVKMKTSPFERTASVLTTRLYTSELSARCSFNLLSMPRSENWKKKKFSNIGAYNEMP